MMPDIEERQAKIEGTFEQIDKRISSLEGELRSETSQIRSEISQFRGEFLSETSQIRSEMASFFRWTIGIMITMWITIIITILLKT